MIFISRSLKIDPVLAWAIQFISPLTSSSLMSVNKEIIVFPVLAFLITGCRYRSPWLISAAIVVSMLARWQLTVFCVILIGLYFVRHVDRRITLSILLITVSFVYYMAKGILEPVLETVESTIATFTEGSGLFERLLELQNDGFYFLVAPLKTAHLLFSLGFHFDAIIDPINVYNDQIIGAFCLVNFVLLLALLIKRRFVFSNDLIAVSLVYAIVFALTPVYAPRYFYAITVLWGLALAGASGSIAAPRRAIAPA